MANNNYIVILVGVCGTGKSAVGQKVAERLEVPFFDVDSTIITNDILEGSLPRDIDMEKWLTSVEELMVRESIRKGCVVSCSILKKEHRQRLTTNIHHPLDWVFMNDTFENAALRLKRNSAPDREISTLKSDFEKLEIPKWALTIDMTYSEQEIVDTILKYMARKYW